MRQRFAIVNESEKASLGDITWGVACNTMLDVGVVHDSTSIWNGTTIRHYQRIGEEIPRLLLRPILRSSFILSS